MLGKNAGERIPEHHSCYSVTRDTTSSPACGHLERPKGRKPSFSPVARWVLPPERVAEDDAGVYTDSMNLIPAIGDHEE
jgi:hypothetical protein